MRIATWNLNHRVGRVRFRPEAAEAAAQLGADVVAFTEYFPRERHDGFCRVLEARGFTHHLLSQDPSEISNRAAGGAHFRRILEAGWRHAQPEEGFSYYGPSGARARIDHVLSTTECRVTGARYVTETEDFVLVGSQGALSDHSALVAGVTSRCCRGPLRQ